MSRRRLRRLLAGFATVGSVLLASVPALSLGAAAAPPEGPLSPDVSVGEGAPPLPSGLSSASWLVVDLTNGNVLAARAGSAKRAPASTLKILTALTFGPGAPAEVTATEADTQVSGRTVGLQPGVGYRTSDLLDTLFVASGNDAALALAHATGDPADAGNRMTQTAAALGATDTTAMNATGLDADGQLTTPYDLAVLTRAALARPELRRAAGLTEATFTGSDGRSRHVTSSNPLLGHYRGAIGVKTGSTADAGQTFVGAAERNGTTVAVVLMEAPSNFGSEAGKLLDWGFSAAGSTRPIATLPTVNPAVPGARPAGDDGPAIAPPAEDGGGVSPLLALALALTVVASAFTYWQGRERQDRMRVPRGAGSSSRTAAAGRPRTVRLPDIEDADPQLSSERESRKIFAP